MTPFKSSKGLAGGSLPEAADKPPMLESGIFAISSALGASTLAGSVMPVAPAIFVGGMAAALVVGPDKNSPPVSARSVLQNPASVGRYAGAACAVLIFLLGAVRRKKLDEKDVGPAIVAFLACCAIWPSIHLFVFVADPASGAALPESLHGYEPYIGVAAVVGFLIAVSGLGRVLYQNLEGLIYAFLTRRL